MSLHENSASYMDENFAEVRTNVASTMGDAFDGHYFDEKWDQVNKSSISLYEACCKVQEYVNKQGDHHVYEKHPERFETPPKWTPEDEMEYTIYLMKYLSLGGDPDYFVSGSGAYGNCSVM